MKYGYGVCHRLGGDPPPPPPKLKRRTVGLERFHPIPRSKGLLESLLPARFVKKSRIHEIKENNTAHEGYNILRGTRK